MSADGEALQAALAVTATEHGPGVYRLVTEAGQPVFTGTVGVADLDSPRPIEACDRYRIGSVTKVYVATLVLQLVADGLLAFDETVQKLLPGKVRRAVAERHGSARSPVVGHCVRPSRASRMSLRRPRGRPRSARSAK